MSSPLLNSSYPSPGQFWLALRRTLPPWSWRENLAELLDFCREAQIDEVIVKVDTEEFSHGQVPMEWLKGYLPALQQIADALRENGIVYSLNPWITLGHADRGRDGKRDFPGMQFMVGHDGVQSRACACPLCPDWRDHTAKLWGLYASTGPQVMWVEDDIRTFNHSPVRFGCFCPLHLQSFNEQTGGSLSRQELVQRLLATGEPDPIRAEWMRFQSDLIVDMARMLSGSVQSVTPSILVGLMSSGPDMHALEGRDWDALADALQGSGDVLVSRPPLGVYAEFSLRGFYYGATSIRKTRAAMNRPCIELTEVENVPFSTFSKSATFTALQISASMAMGCHGATLNLFDHVGSPISDTPEYLEMLQTQRGFWDALAERTPSSMQFSGVGLLQHPRASEFRVLPVDANYAELADDGTSWAFIMEALGIATTWELDRAPVLALCGQTVRALDSEVLERILSGGVLCDLDAALALQEMGFTDALGVRIRRTEKIHASFPVAAEELLLPAFGGAPGRYLTATVPDLMGDLDLGWVEPGAGALIASQLVGPDREPLGPFLTLFENNAGGRVAVLPYSIGRLGEGNSFLHPYRRTQLRKTLEWLARCELPLVVEAGAFSLPLRADSAEYTRLTVFNFSLDPWPQTKLCLATEGRIIRSIDTLVRNGGAAHWLSLAPGSYHVTTEQLQIQHQHPVDFRNPAAYCIRWG